MSRWSCIVRSFYRDILQWFAMGVIVQLGLQFVAIGLHLIIQKAFTRGHLVGASLPSPASWISLQVNNVAEVILKENIYRGRWDCRRLCICATAEHKKTRNEVVQELEKEGYWNELARNQRAGVLARLDARNNVESNVTFEKPRPVTNCVINLRHKYM